MERRLAPQDYRIQCTGCGAWLRITGRSLFIGWLAVMLLGFGIPVILSFTLTDIPPSVFWIPCAALAVWIVIIANGRGFRGLLMPPTGCAKCHYDLRGIDSEVCPECGTEIGVRA